MVVSPPARSLLVCVQCLLYSFSLILPLQTAPSPDRLCSSGLLWSGPNPVPVPAQSLFCCWVLVGAGGGLLFSFCLRCPDINGAALFIKKESESCLKDRNEKNVSAENRLIYSNKARTHPEVQRVNGSSSCTMCYFLSVNEVKRGYCGWPLL